MLDFCHQLILSALPGVFDVDTLRLIPSAMLIDWSIYNKLLHYFLAFDDCYRRIESRKWWK